MSMVERETGAGASEEKNLFPQRVGERLRAARATAGLDLNDVATRTRVPMRHLEAIERSDYSKFPSPTYVIGFVRSYARAVGTDEASMAAAVRAELGRPQTGEVEPIPYKPVDPARVPSRLLAWTAAIVGLLVAIGYVVWRSTMFGADVPDSIIAEAPASGSKPGKQVSVNQPSSSSTSQVVLTATAPVWLSIYDRADQKLFEKEMAIGESYTVPSDADTPRMRTGRADAIRVTVDGREVSPLGPPERTIRDVGVSAAALAARSPLAVGTVGNQESGAPRSTDAGPARISPRHDGG